MQELSISSKNYKTLKVDGSPVKLRVPSAKETAKYGKSIDGLENEEILERAIEFISEKGLEKDIAEGLDLDTLLAIMDFISPDAAKKK